LVHSDFPDYRIHHDTWPRERGTLLQVLHKSPSLRLFWMRHWNSQATNWVNTPQITALMVLTATAQVGEESAGKLTA
jgi:hypothetical protein